MVFADDEGYLTFVGRSDDVFKSSDYRISPFELESILLEHESVAEAAVVPSPDPIRLAIPKAYVLLVSGTERSAETALSIFRALAHAAGAVQTYPADRAGDGTAEDDFRENPPRAVAPAGA